MNKRFYTILGVIVYGGILCGLLALQLLMIDGTFPRIIANLSALALTFPSIIILTLYHKKENSNDSSIIKSKETDSVEGNVEEKTGAIHSPTLSSSSAPASLEEVRIHVYDFLRKKDLSNREVEVAWLIYRGYSNLQIAEELYISEATVKKHASHIYEKMNVTGRKEFKVSLKQQLSLPNPNGTSESFL